MPLINRNKTISQSTYEFLKKLKPKNLQSCALSKARFFLIFPVRNFFNEHNGNKAQVINSTNS